MEVALVLVIGRARIELPAEADTCFADVKATLRSRAAGAGAAGAAPPDDALKIVVKGKVRADAELVMACLSSAEAAGDGRILLKGRVSVPPAHAAYFEPLAAAPSQGAESKRPMPEADGKDGTDEATGRSDSATVSAGVRPNISVNDIPAGALLLTVKQGREQLQVVCQSMAWTVADVKRNLQSQLGVPVGQQRLLIKSKTRADDETLEACGLAPPTGRAMLLFLDGYHRAADGAELLIAAEEEVHSASALSEKMSAQVKHRLADPVDFVIQIDSAVDRLENLLHGLDGRPVPALMADRKLEVLRRIPELLSKLRDFKKYCVHGQR